MTRLVGEQIRDWQLKADGDRQILTIEFIKPIEKEYSLAVFSEQTVEATPATAQLNPPQPLEIERKGRKLRIVSAEPVSRLTRLAKRKCIKGDPEKLVSIDWSSEWKP